MMAQVTTITQNLACLKSITKKWKNIKIVSQTNKGPA